MAQAEEIFVPEMIGFEPLTKIIVAYLKAGGDEAVKSNQEVSQLSDVSAGNVGLNAKFFISLGLLEGERGSYKLTEAGAKYARALDWGRIQDANSILVETIKNRPLVAKTLAYVDLNKPVDREDLIGKIASIANVTNESRYLVGIRGFIQMLTASGLLTEEDDRILLGIREIPEGQKQPVEAKPVKAGPSPPASPPLNITISITENADADKIKSLIRAIREALSEA